MVKIRISYKGYTRTFYTRKDWNNGNKLYLYHYRYPRMTGNWYNDPNYGHLSWQDYEREYAEECSGEPRELPDTVYAMRGLVENNNDAILELAKNGVKKLDLEKFLNNEMEY